MGVGSKPPRNNKLIQARRRLSSPSGAPRPMSRQELAEAINAYVWEKHKQRLNLDENDIGRLERGDTRWPGDLRRKAFRAVLKVATDAELGFYKMRDRRSEDDETPETGEPGGNGFASVSASPSPTGPTTERDSDHPDGTVAVQADAGWAGMLRRTVIKGSAGVAALQLVGGVTPRDSEDLLSPNMVQGLLSVAGHYRRAYHAVPASRLLPAALAHLDLVMSLRPAARPDRERLPLVTAAGEMAALAGVLLGLDAARHEEALSYFDMAWGAARSVGDIELQTVVLGCRSFALAYGGGDHQAGLECADFARKVGQSGACPQTRGWVAAVASERCASLRDLAGCQERLNESRSALATSDDRGVVWRGIGGYNADKLRAYEGGDMMRLRRYGDAEAFLDDALNRLDASMSRHRATALLDRAEARLGLGDIDAACADATQSLTLVTHVQHTGHLDRIEALTARGMATGSLAARTLYREVQLTRLDPGLPIGKVTG